MSCRYCGGDPNGQANCPHCGAPARRQTRQRVMLAVGGEIMRLAADVHATDTTISVIRGTRLTDARAHGCDDGVEVIYCDDR